MESIIIYVLAICYYLFCTIATITYIQENKVYKFWNAFLIIICVMIIAPIAVPIALGIIIGEKLKQN
jgi:hypothetical protein